MTRALRERAFQVGLTAASRVAGAAVTYTQGATTVTISKAIPTDHRFQTIDESGVEAVIETIDWLVEASALNLTPGVGDTIVRVIDGTSHTYSVESPAPGVLHYELSETHRGWYRIHTREDGTYTLSSPSEFDLAGDEVRLDGT